MIRDLLASHSPNALRLYFYSRPYKDDFDFSEKELERFERIDDMIAASMRASRGRSKWANKFFRRIEDDFDTPGALKVLVKAAKARSADLGAMVSVFGLRY
jgi:cysteinyl-tRNA synthetase